MPDSIKKNSSFIVACYEEMRSLETPYEFYSVLKKVASQLEFSNYVILDIPPEHNTHIRPAFLATNWPSELIAEYDRHKLLNNSPIISALRSSQEPVNYDVETLPLDRPDDEKTLARDLFVRFGVPRGVYFPCYDGAGRKGAIAFMGTRSLLSSGETAMLHLLCHYAFGHVHMLLDTNEEGETLKPREVESLEWAARGKTNAECAILMGVSETTVAGYFASVGRKLSASNKTHMVAIAYERGLIHPHAGTRAVPTAVVRSEA